MISAALLEKLSNRSRLLEHLQLTRNQLAQGEQQIAEQKKLIGQLRPDCRERFWATKFLGALEHMQVMHKAHAEHLEQVLAAANSR